MLLNQISPSDPVSVLALRGLEETCPILQDVQFYSRPGSADRVKDSREGTEKSKITRSLNENNSATPPTPSYLTPAKKIVSFDAKVDVTLEDRNEDPEAELAHQTYLEAWEAGWVLQEMFFEGDNGSDSEDFDGLENLVDASWILSGADNGGVILPLGNSDSKRTQQQEAVERFLKQAKRVRGGAPLCYMNDLLKIRWLSVAKELGYYRQSKDELGNEIDMIGNTIVKSAGYKKDGTPILDFDESDGLGNSNTSSIYFVRWGERMDVTCLTSVGVKGRYAGQDGNFIINNINMDAELYVQNNYALVQGKGWRIN